MNANSLMKQFKEFYGITIHNYIVLCKMKHSFNAIKTKGFSVKEAAEEVGYIHQGHFIKTFKSYYGITPGELKKRT